MKKIFPVITILIFISLLGIIFFQIVWIKQALQDKAQQFENSISVVTATAAASLGEDRGNLSPFDRKNGDLLFPLNAFPSTIVHRFTREEIREKIKQAFKKKKKSIFDFWKKRQLTAECVYRINQNNFKYLVLLRPWRSRRRLLSSTLFPKT